MHDIWNPWHGCHKCSPGCLNCYMYALDELRGVETQSNEVRLTKSLYYPLRKDRKGNYKVRAGEMLRVNMTSDTFVEEADVWRDEMWNVIRQRPDVIFWLLTKRPERILDHLPYDWGNGWDNVCLNITCENQEMADIRIPILLSIPSKHKGIMIAPMLGPVDITKGLVSGEIENVMLGGENYNSPRPCHLEWVQSVSAQCRQYRVNFCWFESGTNYWVAGKSHFVPSKQKQSIIAFCAGLNQRYYEPQYLLRDPVDNHLLEKNELYIKQYNLKHCLFCSNQLNCNGCSGCGNCQEVDRVDPATFFSVQSNLVCDRDVLNSYIF